jgi:hypothetical protein
VSAPRQIRPAAHFLARFGCFAIGTVYVLIGVWAMLALGRLAQPAADEERILQRIWALPFGGVLSGAVALGSAGYVIWLLFQAVFDPYRFGKTWKGIVERIGIALSALAYGAIAAKAVRVLLGDGGHGEHQEQDMVATILRWPAGQWLVGAAGAVVVIVGLYQLVYVYEADHKRQLRLRGRSKLARFSIDALAWAGYGARCAILVVLGGFLLRAAYSFNAGAVGDTDSAFDFLGLGGGRLGDALFSVVAVGTIAYGLFMYANGVYFEFGDD